MVLAELLSILPPFDVAYLTLHQSEGRPIEALLVLLGEETFSIHREAADILQDMDNSSNVYLYDTIVKLVQPNAYSVLAAGQKLQMKKALSQDEFKDLADFVKLHEEDNLQQRQAREWVFGWLLRWLETEGPTTTYDERFLK